MATNIQRAQAIADAILNRAATPAQVNRLGQALAFNAGFLADYNALTAGEKAGFLVSRIRSQAVNLVKEMEAGQAIDSARASAWAAVEAEFVEGL